MICLPTAFISRARAGFGRCRVSSRQAGLVRRKRVVLRKAFGLHEARRHQRRTFGVRSLEQGVSQRQEGSGRSDAERLPASEILRGV